MLRVVLPCCMQGGSQLSHHTPAGSARFRAGVVWWQYCACMLLTGRKCGLRCSAGPGGLAGSALAVHARLIVAMLPVLCGLQAWGGCIHSGMQLHTLRWCSVHAPALPRVADDPWVLHVCMCKGSMTGGVCDCVVSRR